MAKVNINDVLQGLIQPIGSLKGGSTYPVTAADQIWVYTDHDTHRPLDEYLSAMKTETAETTQTFVSNATALTESKIAKTSIVGGRAAKCKVGDIVLVADGNIYKISTIDEIDITLELPALASYATAATLPENMALYGDLAATDEEFTGGTGGGTGSGGVSPTLNLINLGEDGPSLRTTITQTEKDNLEKGLYNQVVYSPSTDQFYEAYSPSKLWFDQSSYMFVQFGIDIDTSSISIKNASVYEIKLGKKDTNGNYPITIEKLTDIVIGDSSGITPKLITSTADYAALTDTDYFISINITEDSSVVKKGTYILSGNKANGYSYWYPENKSKDTNMEVYWHYIHYDSTGLSGIGFTSHLDIGKNNQSGFAFEGEFPNSGALFGGFTVEQVPLFSKYTLVSNAVDPTPILPCTASDNGKVLSVVNGEAQWASRAYYSHFITLTSTTLGAINFNYYDTRKEAHTLATLKTALKGRSVSCSGFVNDGGAKKIANYVEGGSDGAITIRWFGLSDGATGGTALDSDAFTLSDAVKPVE